MNNTGSVMRPPPPKLYTKAGMELFANTQKTNGINGMTSSPNTNTFPNNSLPTNNPSTNNTGMILQNSSAQSSNIFMNRANNTVGIFNNNNTVNNSNANNNLNVFSNTANNSNSSFPNTINNNNTSSSNNNKPWINLSNSKNNPTITNGQTLNSNPIFSNNITNMGNNNMGSNMGNNNMGSNMGNNNMGSNMGNNMGNNNMGSNMGNIMGNNMGINNMGNSNIGINNMGNNNTILGRSITESPFSKSRNIFSNTSKPRINDSVTLLKNQTFEPVRLIAHQKLKQSPNYVNCVASLPQNAKRILCKDEVRMEDYTNYYRQTGRHNFHQNYNHQQPRNSPIGQFTSLLQDNKKKSATSMLEYSFFGNLVKQNPYHQINGEQHKSYQNINELQAHPLTYSIYDNDFYAKVQQRISQTYSENDHIFYILGLFSGESQQAQKFFRQFHPNLFVDIINKYQFYTYLKNKEKEHKPFYSSSHQNSINRIDNSYENDYYLQNGIMGLDRFQGLSRRQQVDQFYDQYVQTQLGQLFSDDQSIKHIFYNNKPLMYKILSRNQQIYNFLQTKTSQLIKPKTQLQSNYEHFYLPKRQTFDFRHSIQRNSAQRPKKNSLFSAYERQKYGKDKPLYNFGQESDQQSDQEVISVKLGQFQDQLKSFSYRLSDKIRFSYEA